MSFNELSRTLSVLVGVFLVFSMLHGLSAAGRGGGVVTGYVISIVLVAGPFLLFSASVGGFLLGGVADNHEIQPPRDLAISGGGALLGAGALVGQAELLFGYFFTLEAQLTSEHKALVVSALPVVAISLFLILRWRFTLVWERGGGMKDLESGMGIGFVFLRAISLVVLAGAFERAAHLAVARAYADVGLGVEHLIAVAFQISLFLFLWACPIFSFRKLRRAAPLVCNPKASGVSHVANVLVALLALGLVIDGIADSCYWLLMVSYCGESAGSECMEAISIEELRLSAAASLVQVFLSGLMLAFRSSLVVRWLDRV